MSNNKIHRECNFFSPLIMNNINDNHKLSDLPTIFINTKIKATIIDKQIEIL